MLKNSQIAAYSQNFKTLDSFRQNRLEKREIIKAQSIFGSDNKVDNYNDFMMFNFQGHKRFASQNEQTPNTSQESHSESKSNFIKPFNAFRTKAIGMKRKFLRN